MEWPTDPRRGILTHRFAQLRCETSEPLRQVESFKALIDIALTAEPAGRTIIAYIHLAPEHLRGLVDSDDHGVHAPCT